MGRRKWARAGRERCGRREEGEEEKGQPTLARSLCRAPGKGGSGTHIVQDDGEGRVLHREGDERDEAQRDSKERRRHARPRRGALLAAERVAVCAQVERVLDVELGELRREARRAELNASQPRAALLLPRTCGCRSRVSCTKMLARCALVARRNSQIKHEERFYPAPPSEEKERRGQHRFSRQLLQRRPEDALRERTTRSPDA